MDIYSWNMTGLILQFFCPCIHNFEFRKMLMFPVLIQNLSYQKIQIPLAPLTLSALKAINILTAQCSSRTTQSPIRYSACYISASFSFAFTYSLLRSSKNLRSWQRSFWRYFIHLAESLEPVLFVAFHPANTGLRYLIRLFFVFLPLFSFWKLDIGCQVIYWKFETKKNYITSISRQI